MRSPPAEIEFVQGYVPGALGRVAELHGRYYHQNWGFGLTFETKVATELAQFFDRFSNSRDGFWVAMNRGRVQASIAIDAVRADDDGAHLRWFIVAESMAGSGVGTRLLDAGLNWCRARRYPRVYLWTFEGLSAARHLYERFGFRLVAQQRGSQWGTEVNEQRFALELDSAPRG